MHRLVWYNGTEPAQTVWTPCPDTAGTIARGVKRIGYKVVWLTYTMTTVKPREGYEQAYEEWKAIAP